MPQPKLELNVIAHANVLRAYPISSFVDKHVLSFPGCSASCIIFFVRSYRRVEGPTTAHTYQFATLLEKDKRQWQRMPASSARAVGASGGACLPIYLLAHEELGGGVAHARVL